MGDNGTGNSHSNTSSGKRSRVAGSSPQKTTRKQKKTTYFFRPENKLTGTRKPDENPTTPETYNQHSIKEPDNYDSFIVQNQSSDESFEGIKWKINPSHYKNSPKKQNQSLNPSSSPLKNILETGDTSSAIINDQAEQMLLKYGSGFHNISSQTLPPKAVSDLGQSKNSRDATPSFRSNPPSLQRARSLGALNTSDVYSNSQNSSRLKTWISMIGSDDKKEDKEEGKEEEDIDEDKEEKAKKHTIYKNVKLQPSLAEKADSSSLMNEQNRAQAIASKTKDGSDDVFSDDEDILATYAAKTQSMPLIYEVKKQPITVNSSPPLTPRESSNDPFGDDFSDFSDDFDLSKMNMNDESVEKTEFSDKIEQLSAMDDGLGLYEPKLSYTRSDLKRYKIANILRTSYKVDNKSRQQTILTVKCMKNTESKLVLRGEYSDLDFGIGDIINVVITEPKSPNLIDDNQNVLIWHPDVLVSSTTVSQQLDCPRKSVLTDRFKFPGTTSLPLIAGVILHEIFQSCFVSENWTEEYTTNLMDSLVNDNILALFSIGSDPATAKNELNKSLPYLREWFHKYYQVRNGKEKINTTTRNEVYFSVNKALDIEENIWSPMFGLKGKVDVTLEANLKANDRKGTYLIPMEIKTGREYLSHHAQSSLYALLFKDRYDIDVNSFLLVYTKEKLTKLGDIKSSDLKSLINLRNRAAAYLREGIRQLPEVIKRSICDRCDVQEACMTLHYLVENGDCQSSGLKPDKFNDIVSHIGNKQLYKDFFTYWDMLITKEELVMNKLKKELWTLTAKEREEKSGNALANMVITEHSTTENQPFQFSYTFVRANTTESFGSLQNSQISKYDKVVVSDEEGHFTIAYAYVTIIRPTMIVLSADRRIINSSVKENKFNDKENQVYQGVLHSSVNGQVLNSKKLFRIDKDHMFHGMGLARFNILNLLLPNGDTVRRKQIVDLEPPRFTQNQTITDKQYNTDQLKAINKVLSSEDYCLILGMPGTGKTTLIAGLINHLVNQGKSVLLTSYTHSAVDNILIKVKEYGVGILRVGNPSKVHKEIRQFVPQGIETFDQYMHMYMDPPVVGATCLGINDAIFNIRDQFDYCIIDEASQVSFPISLGPLKFSDKFVLVGDHNQLPPLVQNTNATVKKGMSQSLFQYLNDKFPQSVVELTYQYRMSADIMKLSNVLIYNNRLKCGTEQVAQQKLILPDPTGYKTMVQNDKDIWMQWVLNEKNNVIFLDHDLVSAPERVVGEKVENPVEALLIWQIIEALNLCGVTQSQIGVMSLYRAQLRLLNKYFLDKPDVEVMTADQFQGRDKECVVISLVRSNKDMRVGDLLQEWRRINVAVTRSKSKLIILGSKSTLSSGEGVLKEFLDLVFNEKWMYRLPPKAHTHYIQPPTNVSQHTSGGRSSLRSSGKENVQESPLRAKVTRDSRAVNGHQLIKDIINDI